MEEDKNYYNIILNILSGIFILSCIVFGITSSGGESTQETISSSIGGISVIAFIFVLVCKAIHNSIINNKRKNNIEKYKTYIESKERNELRKQRIKEQPICECCGVNKSINLHHLSYNNIGDEAYEDLVCVCTMCHEECHHNDWGGKIDLNETDLRRRFNEVKSKSKNTFNSKRYK